MDRFTKIKKCFTRRRSVFLCSLFVIVFTLLAVRYMNRVVKEQAASVKLSVLYPSSAPFYGTILHLSNSKNPGVWCRPFQDWIDDTCGENYAYPLDGYYLAGDHQITDQTIDLLRNMNQMKQLNFSGTQISDKTILRLREFPMLMELQLYNVDVSDKTLNLLKRANPDLEIFR